MTSFEHARPERSFLRLTLVLAGIVVILAGVKAIASLVNLLLFSFLIVVLLAPLHRRLRARGMSNAVATLVLLLVIILGSVAVFAIAGLALYGAVRSLPAYLQQFDAEIDRLTSALAQSGADLSQFAGALKQAAAYVLGSVADIASAGVGLLVNWAFFILIVLFGLLEVETFPLLLQRAIGGKTPTYQRFAATLDDMTTYMRILTIINLAIGAGSALFLWVIGIPQPLLWGFVSFVFGYVPYIGYWIAILPPLILALGKGGIGLAIVVLIGYWVINGVLSSIIAPRLYGKGLDLSVVLTLVVVFFWIVILGPMGGLLAIPLTQFIKAAVLPSYPDTAWVSVALSDSSKIDETPAVAENPPQL